METNELPTKRVQPPRWVTALSRNFIIRIILAMLIISVPVAGLSNLFHLIPGDVWQNALWAKFIRLIISITLMHGMYILYVRIVERRREREINPSYLLKDGLIGLSVGVALIAVIHIFLAITGNYHIAEYLGWQNLFFFVYLSLVSGYTEELIFRGVFFRLIEQGLGSWLALLASSLLFGFMHMVNPNATILSSAFIALEAGLLTAGAYMLTRRLWMSMAIHFAWNFTLGGIWGTPVSGISEPGMLRGELTGNTLMTGGEFGIEASVVTAIIATALGAYFIYLSIKRGHFIPAPWKRPASWAPSEDEMEELATVDDLEVNGGESLAEEDDQQ